MQESAGKNEVFHVEHMLAPVELTLISIADGMGIAYSHKIQMFSFKCKVIYPQLVALLLRGRLMAALEHLACG